MRKLAVLAVAAVISGCASGPETTEIISSSAEEVIQQEPLETEALAKLEEEHTVQETVTEVIKKAAEQSNEAGSDASKMGYSIQVLALSHNKGFTTYMNKLPSDKPVWTNEKQLNGVPWFTLLYGQFETREQARQALDALPNDVKTYGPFIRDLDEVKSSPSPKLTRLN